MLPPDLSWSLRIRSPSRWSRGARSRSQAFRSSSRRFETRDAGGPWLVEDLAQTSERAVDLRIRLAIGLGVPHRPHDQEAGRLDVLGIAAAGPDLHVPRDRAQELDALPAGEVEVLDAEDERAFARRIQEELGGEIEEPVRLELRFEGRQRAVARPRREPQLLRAEPREGEDDAPVPCEAGRGEIEVERELAHDLREGSEGMSPGQGGGGARDGDSLDATNSLDLVEETAREVAGFSLEEEERLPRLPPLQLRDLAPDDRELALPSQGGEGAAGMQPLLGQDEPADLLETFEDLEAPMRAGGRDRGRGADRRAPRALPGGWGRSSSGRIGAPRARRRAGSSRSSPGTAGVPISASAMLTPSEKRSLRLSACAPSKSSGAMYGTVPRTRVPSGVDSSRDSPKSRILTSKRAGFTSSGSGIEEEVLGLEVVMHDAAGMDDVEGIADPGEGFEEETPPPAVARPAVGRVVRAALREEQREGLAKVEALHVHARHVGQGLILAGIERRAACGPVTLDLLEERIARLELPEVVALRDGGVAQLAEDLELPARRLEGLAAPQAEELEGAAPTRLPQVLGEEDDALGGAGDLLDDLVATSDRCGFGQGLGSPGPLVSGGVSNP